MVTVTGPSCRYASSPEVLEGPRLESERVHTDTQVSVTPDDSDASGLQIAIVDGNYVSDYNLPTR
jgi:hypothetical protein